MPELTLELKDLGRVLRDIPRKDHDAVKMAIRRTLSVDAFRWIDWSIRGGGMENMPGGALPKYAPPITPPDPDDPCPRQPPPDYRMPIDTGDYARGWEYSETEDGGMFYSTSQPPIKAGVIEQGRRAAPIPIEPLAEWVRRKLGCKDPKRSRSIAFAISRHASKHARPGLYVLARAHPKISDAFFENLQAILQRRDR